MLSTLWEATHLYTPNQSGTLMRKTKFLVRAVAQWPYSHRWFRFLSEQPELAAVLPLQPQWLHKLQRPYMRQGLSAGSKLRLLRQHFALFLTRLPQPLRQQLLTEQAQTMARFTGKSGAGYRIDLSLTHTMDKEGELMLTLREESGDGPLVTLAFSFGLDSGGSRRILLGCLQGPRGEGGRERFRTVTKDLHGLLPKALMVKALAALARQMHIATILAVSKHGHVHNSPLRRYSAIQSDYDALWESLGGIPEGKHYFRLDSHMPVRDLAEVPSNKRAQYQRRQAVEASIEEQFAQFWAQPAAKTADKPVESAKVLRFVPRQAPDAHATVA
jgi:uncharacterized protein VirK/YbjX